MLSSCTAVEVDILIRICRIWKECLILTVANMWYLIRIRMQPLWFSKGGGCSTWNERGRVLE